MGGGPKILICLILPNSEFFRFFAKSIRWEGAGLGPKILVCDKTNRSDRGGRDRKSSFAIKPTSLAQLLQFATQQVNIFRFF